MEEMRRSTVRQKRERLREAAQAADDAGDGTAASGGGALVGRGLRLYATISWQCGPGGRAPFP